MDKYGDCNGLVLLQTVLLTLSFLTTPTQQQHEECPLNSASSQNCQAKSCLSCTNASSKCSRDAISGTVTCVADTAGCSAVQCNGCSHCAAAYYQADTVRFTSGCISNGPKYSCQSSRSECLAVVEIVSGSTLDFPYDPVYCTCYGVNCTANVSFHYVITRTIRSEPLMYVTPTPSLTQGTLIGNSNTTLESEKLMELSVYDATISLLSCLLVITLVLAIILVVVTGRKIKNRRNLFV